MSRPCACLLILVSVIVFQSRQSSANNLPTDPNDQYYEAFQNVSSPNYTAKVLMRHFFPEWGLEMLLRRTTSLENFFCILCKVDPLILRMHQSVGFTDMVIVMDGSGSVGRCQFEKGRKALQHMVALADYKTRGDVKSAAITFAASATVNFKFLLYAENEITQISYPGGSTNTQAGLTEAKKLFDDPSSGRRIAGRKIVFLVTDGHSNVQTQLTIPKANALKESGVEIFVVAVGTYISGIDEMVKVASFPPEEFLFRVKTHQQFWEVIKLVIKDVTPWKYTILQGQYDPPC